MPNRDHRTGSARGDWNCRAREDYRHAIYSSLTGDDLELEFRRAGERDAETVMSLLDGHNAAGWRVLEYGCGVGRLMEPLSRHFGEVHGVDVSDEMVRLGRERSSLSFHLLENGRLPFGDAEFDLVYSMFVFQHMPKRDFYAVLPEIARVLRDGGLFLFHLTHPYSLRRWVQALGRLDQLSLRRGLPSLLGMGTEAPETYRRRYFTPRQVARLLEENELRPIRSTRTGPRQRYAWHLAERGPR